MDSINEELRHHGIKGQKWGVRRFQNKDGSLTPAGRKRYSQTKRGVAAAESLLGKYGKQSLSAGGALNKTAGKNVIDDKLGIDSKTGLKRLPTPMTAEENVKLVNKINYLDQRTFMNCGQCTMAFELRMRGYDVRARGNPNGMYWSAYTEMFSGFNKGNFCTYSEATRKYSNMPNGPKKAEAVKSALKKEISNSFKDDYARGTLIMTHTYGSHWINWVKENGDVKFYDAQNHKNDLDKKLFAYYKYFDHRDTAKAIRLDNLEIKGDQAKRFVYNTGDKFTTSEYKTPIVKGQMQFVEESDFYGDR